MPNVEAINYEELVKKLEPRTKDWHKGRSGHVLVAGGELGYSGASRMAGEAALRVGAGMVSVATRPENAVVMNSVRPELMCHGIYNAEDLLTLIAKADVIVLGSGLGLAAWAVEVWTALLTQSKPLVLDADGLNLLAKEKHRRNDWVLTPHPGEAGRLLGQKNQEIQMNRLQAANEIVKQYGGVCVLKGAGSLVVTANSAARCDHGNPGMATAGMGDILSGVIGGLIAQGMPLAQAAELGVCIHAMAGDLAAKEGGERGMVATDLLPHLRRLCNPM